MIKCILKMYEVIKESRQQNSVPGLLNKQNTSVWVPEREKAEIKNGIERFFFNCLHSLASTSIGTYFYRRQLWG